MSAPLAALRYHVTGAIERGEAQAICAIEAPATIGRHGYNPVAVNQAIEASNRAGRRIGGKEARLIHALLKGRG